MALAVSSPSLAAPRPEWAFFVPTHSVAPHAALPKALALDVLNPPDWYPAEHPAMPAVVAHGSPPHGAATAPLLPCALCHLPNGAGHVESASLAGLPADYIVRQFAEFRSGERRIAVGNARAQQFLSALKSNYTDEQVQAAAVYFSALAPRPWVQVREAKRVPVSAVDPDSLMRTAIAGEHTELLGRRIIELPVSESGLRKRDAHSGFIAYVPEGSLAEGKILTTSNAHGAACTACHGESLKGLGGIPPLAGRPPSYLVRQLWGYQSGGRHGSMAAPMRMAVAGLRMDEMLAMAAYLASLPP
ncbi:MAG TPA: c-type cytochrome [Steroidobacteraceae bacterium]